MVNKRGLESLHDIKFKTLDLNDHFFPDLRKACNYWSKKKSEAGGIAPSWSEFNMLELPPELLPRICVVDIEHEPLNFIYRYWGTAITNLHHYDLSGKSVMDLTPPEYAQCIWDQYNKVFSTKQPHTFLTEVPLTEDYNTFYIAMRLPLSSNGRTIDKIIAAEEYGKERDQLRILFSEL